MKQISVLVFFLLAVQFCFAVEVSLHGTVKNRAGKPVPEAEVVLKRNPSITARTDQNGVFQLNSEILKSRDYNPVMSKSHISIHENLLIVDRMRTGEPVRIHLFDARGRLLGNQCFTDSDAGTCRIKLFDIKPADGMYIIRCRIGNRNHIIRMIVGGGRILPQSISRDLHASKPAILSKKSSPTIDTLIVTATDYAAKYVDVDTYTGHVDIVLEPISFLYGSWIEYYQRETFDERLYDTTTYYDSIALFQFGADTAVITFNFAGFGDSGCSFTDTAVYSASGTVLNGEWFSGTFPVEGIPVTYSTSYRFEGPVLILSMLQSGTAQGHAEWLYIESKRRIEMYLEPYSGDFPPMGWSSAQCSTGTAGFLELISGVGISTSILTETPKLAKKRNGTPLAGTWRLVKKTGALENHYIEERQIDDPSFILTPRKDTVVVYCAETEHQPYCHAIDTFAYSMDKALVVNDELTYRNIEENGEFDRESVSWYEHNGSLVLIRTEAAGGHETDGVIMFGDLEICTTITYMKPYAGETPPADWPQTICDIDDPVINEPPVFLLPTLNIILGSWKNAQFGSSFDIESMRVMFVSQAMQNSADVDIWYSNTTDGSTCLMSPMNAAQLGFYPQGWEMKNETLFKKTIMDLRAFAAIERPAQIIDAYNEAEGTEQQIACVQTGDVIAVRTVEANYALMYIEETVSGDAGYIVIKTATNQFGL
jgi:hypothetical protein